MANSDEEADKIWTPYKNDPILNALRVSKNAKMGFIQIVEDYFMSKHYENKDNKSSYNYLNNAFKNLNDGDVAITTNWDTLAERTLLDLGYWYPSDWCNFLRILNEHKHQRYKNKSNPCFPQSKIKVLKLHGSVGWHFNEKTIYLSNILLSALPIPPQNLQVIDQDYPEVGYPSKSVLI